MRVVFRWMGFLLSLFFCLSFTVVPVPVCKAIAMQPVQLAAAADKAPLPADVAKGKVKTKPKSKVSAKDGEYELVDIASEDSAFVMVEFDNGIKGQVTLSQVAGGHKNDLQVDIDCANYSMTWQQEYADKLDINHRQIGNIVRFAGPDMVSGDAVRYAQLSSGHSVGWADALKNTISEFYRTLRGADVNYATFTEADYVVRIVEACLKSAKEGRWIEVETDPELSSALAELYAMKMEQEGIQL